MKYIIIFLTLLLVSCNQDSTNKNQNGKTISSSIITDSLKCDSCGKNLKKYISTNHTVQLEDGTTKHYCSLNCLVDDFNKIKNNVKTIYVIDVRTKEFIPAKEAHYVIRAPFGITKKTTAYAYKDLEYANRFKKDFNGKEITDFNSAFKKIN
jgi:nitrous oxide reductase accessory protein NosL